LKRTSYGKGKRGKDRPSHQSGRYVEIPQRVVRKLYAGVRKLGKCWLPAGKLKAEGYKHVYWTDSVGVDRTLTSAHLIGRVFYRNGDFLDDDEVPHHTCINAWCINPDHIEVIAREDHQALHVKLRAVGYRRSSRAA
jgi:hypothetical protein